MSVYIQSKENSTTIDRTLSKLNRIIDHRRSFDQFRQKGQEQYDQKIARKISFVKGMEGK